MKFLFERFLRRPEKFTEGAAILSFTTFLSYLTGLTRDKIFAHKFGAGRILDIYNASFVIPDLLLNILVSSALSAAFIPVFTGLQAEGEKEKANELANTMLHAAVFVIVIASLATGIAMPFLAPRLAPGFSKDELETLVSLSRFMLLSPVFMAISSTLGAMLVSFRRFLPYGLSPIFYNFGIIGGAFLGAEMGPKGLVLGTIFGAFLHGVPRLFAMRGAFRYEAKMQLRDPFFLRILRLTLPKMVGHPVEPLTFSAFTNIASTLAAGSLTAMNFARNFQSVPFSIFGISFSVAIFPQLAAAGEKNDRAAFLRYFKKTLRDILFFTLPAAAGLFFISEVPIRILLGGGNFTDENVLRTAHILSLFALSIPTESAIHLLARSFYALKNTLIPVALSVLGMGIGVGFAFSKAPAIGLAAVPYGFLLGSAIEAMLLGLLLKRKLDALAAR